MAGPTGRWPPRREGSFEGLFGLNREADGHVGFAVEYLDDVIAQQAAELALGPLAGNQFDPSVPRVALRTAEVGLSHTQTMLRRPSLFQPASLSQSTDQRLPRPANDIHNRFRELAGSP
jgi:hypothetical protein